MDMWEDRTREEDCGKEALRRTMRRARAELDPTWAAAASGRIQERLAGWGRFRAARRVLFYMARADEVQTDWLIQWAYRAGIQVVVPRVEPNSRDLALYRIEDVRRDVQAGFQGILEPRVPEEKRVAPGAIDLVLVPGLAFDDRGFRLGFGGGYYDRLLAQAPGVMAVGVGFRFQVVTRIPRRQWDQAVGYLVTEEWLKSCGTRPRD